MAAEMSGAAAAAIRNIQSGNAPYQRRRDLRNRAIVGGIQAGLMGLSGVVKAGLSEQEELDAKRKIMANAIENAKRIYGPQMLKEAGYRDMASMEEKWAERDDVRAIRSGSTMSMTGEKFSDRTSGELAGEALKKLANDKMATELPDRDGKWSPAGMEATMGDAEAIGDDIITAKSIIRGSRGINPSGAGLGGSLRRNW